MAALSSLAVPPWQLQASSHRLYPLTKSMSSTRPLITATMSPPRPPATTPANPTKPPLRELPGDYGLPLIGPYLDRLDYFYNQGKVEYFKSRIQKHQSTVFRTNMPPGPFITFDSKVIVLLDAKSFPVLFDMSKVEKRDLFTGTYKPSTDLTGGYRVLPYLDPSEPNHAKLKNLLFKMLSSRRDYVIPEFQKRYAELFQVLENDLAKNGKASFGDASDQAAFDFLARSYFGVNPADTKLGTDGPNLVLVWLAFQLHPLATLGLPSLIDDLLLHTFQFPPFLIKSNYQRLYEFFYESSTDVLDEAEKLGLSREEACHNLLFATCFNTYGGMKIFFPAMLKYVGNAGVKLHTQLAQEIRSAVKANDGKVSMRALEQMPLTKSTVYEALRLEPPVDSQYGRAKRNLIIESHDAAFEVKKGEMLYGFQPFATKDPKIFNRPEEFVADRFVGEEGEKLLKYVLWSNGPETESPTVSNKQCAGKDFVGLVSRLLLVEFFLRYDSFEVEVGTSALGSALTITSLKKASFQT